MTYAVNQKLNSYPQASTGLNSQGFSSQQLQELNGETIKQGIVDNTVVRNLSDEGEEKNKWLDKILLLPTWVAMILAMEKFNTACKGTFEESLIGKVSAWGEKIGQKTPFLDKFGEKVASWNNSFRTKIVPKSKILSTVFNTPTVSENTGAKMIGGGTKFEIAGDAVQRLLEKVTEDGKVNLDKFGITLEEYQELKQNSHKPENIKKLIEIFEKQDKNDYFAKTKVGKIPFSKKICGETKYLSEVIPGAHKLLDSKLYYSSYVNKLKAFESGNKTFLGKKLPAAMLRVVEGITNGTAGGKIAIFMAAMFIAGSIKDAINAPRRDKVSTFAESNVNGIGFYLLIPFCMRILNGFGGLKYLGMSKEKVEEYRKVLHEFNKKADAAGFASKNEYKAARKELKGMLKGDLKGFKNALYAPFRRAAKILTVGLETPRPFSYTAINEAEGMLAKAKRIFKNEKWWTLQKGLGFLRAPLVMFLIAPPFVNLATRASHLVFGRPKKSLLDKEKPEKEKQQIPQPVMLQPQAQIPEPSQAQPASPMQPVQRENLIDMYKAKNNVSFSGRNDVTTSPETSQNVPQEEVTQATLQKEPGDEVSQAAPQEPVRTYIPSSEGVKIDPNKAKEQDDKISAAFKKASIAEKVANQNIHHKK